MTIQMKVNDFHVKDRHLQGMLLSLFSAVEDIVLQRRKATYLNHFWRERLSRDEKRILLRALGELTSQLRTRNEAIYEDVNQTDNLRLPEEFSSFLHKF